MLGVVSKETATFIKGKHCAQTKFHDQFVKNRVIYLQYILMRLP